MKIGKAIDTLLIEAEKSPEWLSKELNKGPTYINNMRAKHSVTTKTIESICSVLNVKPSRFIEIAES